MKLLIKIHINNSCYQNDVINYSKKCWQNYDKIYKYLEETEQEQILKSFNSLFKS